MRRPLSNLLLGTVMACCFLLVSCGGGGGGSATPPPGIPTVSVSSTQVQFGDIILDNFSEQVITIRNVGSATLTVGQIAQANPLSPPFSILSNNCSGNGLTANEACTFKVRFSPTSQGKGFTDSFDIPTNDPNDNSVTVNVSGNAEGLRLSINDVITSGCPSIDVFIAVSDKDGNPISGLIPDNVDLFENGVAKTFALSNVLSPPVAVALVLDSSDTMTPAKDNVIASSKGFIDLLNPDDRAAIIKFAKTIELKQAFTDNTNILKSAIDNEYTGSIFATVLYDALWYAIDLTANQTNRRSIIVISDGKDEDPANPDRRGSVRTLTEVISHAQQTGVAIFTIGLGVTVSTDVMVQLANDTGGQYFAAPDSSQLPGVYQAIRDILDGQYRLRYTSTSTGGGLITLDLLVNFNGLQGDVSTQIQGCP